MDFVRISSRSIPVKSSKWLNHADAIYTRTNFSEIFMSQFCKYSQDLPQDEDAVDEITNYIVSTNFFENYELETKYGVVVLYRGFPFFTLLFSEAKKNPNNFIKFLIIDVDNYKFNKTIEKKVKEVANRRFWHWVYEGILVVASLVVIGSGIYLLTH